MISLTTPSPLKLMSDLWPFGRQRVQAHDARNLVAQRALELADHASIRLARILECVAPLGDDDVDDLVRGFVACTLPMIHALRDDTTRYGALHKHLTLYVDAAIDATDRFVQEFAPLHDPAIKAPYLEQLCDLAQHFTSEMAQHRISWQSHAA